MQHNIIIVQYYESSRSHCYYSTVPVSTNAGRATVGLQQGMGVAMAPWPPSSPPATQGWSLSAGALPQPLFRHGISPALLTNCPPIICSSRSSSIPPG